MGCPSSRKRGEAEEAGGGEGIRRESLRLEGLVNKARCVTWCLLIEQQGMGKGQRVPWQAGVCGRDSGLVGELGV